MKGKKVLLLNDTTNWYHFGCTATSFGLKEGITTLGYDLTSYPVTETYKFSSFPTNATAFKDISNFEIFRQNNPEIISLIEKNNIIVFNGEGTLHGVRSAPLSLLYIAYASKIFLNKHVEIINHSMYPQDNLLLYNPEISGLYKLVYDTIDFSSIREPISYALAKKMNINAVESFDCMPLYIKSLQTSWQ
ncbi:hypothetical protein NOVO_02065 [Rickettsiales bacterium Ac37b]|nr:hypothetical protein NOVO_02065 [Rickettsiales bacterium Ac37b]